MKELDTSLARMEGWAENLEGFEPEAFVSNIETGFKDLFNSFSGFADKWAGKTKTKTKTGQDTSDTGPQKDGPATGSTQA